MSVSVACFQLYTVSQDGTLCVWESDAELEDLVLKKDRDKRKPPSQGEEDEEEEEGDKAEGEVIRGKAEAPKEKDGRKNVRYQQISK